LFGNRLPNNNNDFSTALEIEMRSGADWDPIYMIDKDNAEKGAILSQRASKGNILSL